MKRKVVLLKESKTAQRVHPLNAEELERVTGGIIGNPVPVPQPLPPPGSTGPIDVDRDWGWW